MRLRFTPRATADLQDIADYINDHNASAALRVRQSILNTLQTVIDFPRLGRAQDIEGVRKISTPRFPYVIYFLVEDAEDEIIVLTIRHAARRPLSDDA